MRHLKTSKVIFSVYNGNRSEKENGAQHEKVKRRLDLLEAAYTEVIGSYKGEIEKGFLFQSTDIARFLNALFLAFNYAKENGQESVLTVNSDDTATLVFIDANEGDDEAIRREKIGVFKRFHGDLSALPDSWTKIGEDYYVVE